MSKFDNPQTDLVEEQQQQSQCTACTEHAVHDDDEPDFKITVRKVPMKVQARGVLAE